MKTSEHGRGFAAEATWDPHFVLAPPKLVHAQI